MRHSGPRLIIVLAFVAFISLGLPDGVLGVAWPSIRGTFRRPLSHLGQLLAAGIAGYIVSSFFGGQIVRAVGVGKLLLGSSVMVAAALAGFALAPGWGAVLASATLGGLGAGAIDAGINTFAASRFSPRVVNWLHASWGIGATTGPLLMTAVLARHLDWRVGYSILGAAMALLSFVFLFTLRLWTVAPGAAAHDEHATASVGEALRRPVVWVQLVLFFVYCGIESAAGQLMYSLFTESRGVAPATAGLAVGAYWGFLTIGRIVFGQLAATMSRRAIIRTGMTLAPLAALLVWWDVSDAVSFAGVALLGFGLAPIFPTLISATPQRVGHYFAPQSVGFQVAAANVGIATLPGAVGFLATRYGLEILCPYLVVAPLVLFALNEAAERLSRRGATYTEGVSPEPA
jgi:fucose permease